MAHFFDTCFVELWCFLRSAHQQTVEQTMETPVIRDAIALVIMSLYGPRGLRCVMICCGCVADHRPHSRQVTGARCTEVRARQSWAEFILLKASNGKQASGLGDKRFFRFKRNAKHLWTAFIRHHLNDIIHQQVMRFTNQRSKFANIFKSIKKIPNASEHSRYLFTSCRTRPLWHNGSSLGPHVLNGYGSMTSRMTQHLLTCGEQVTKIRSTNLHCADV